MEPKIAESMDDTSRDSAVSYSVDDTVQTKKSIGCRSSQRTTSEASNMISGNSNLDSCNENAERKAGLKHSNISGKSHDVEVPKKVLSAGSVRGKLRTPSSHQKDADDGATVNNYVDLRGLEGHDDNISCVSGSDEASNMSNSSKVITDTKVLTISTASPRSLASEEYIKAGQPEETSFMDKHESEGIHNKPSGDVVSRAVSGHKSASYASHDIQDSETGHVGGNSEPSARECPKVEAESDSDDLVTKTLNSLEQKKDGEKSSELPALPEARETSMHSDPVNESDESDILEHDVKVCDICGDAGREDLLAVCCSCSEGAEHTYCMKEMMDKIPEGDWLCEDCKSEKRTAQEKVKCDLVVGDGVDSKNADICGKLDGLDTDAKNIKTKNDSSHVKLSRKREADDSEVSSAAKRQVFESKIRFPNVLSPRRAGMLPRDSSFKNLDRERVKPAYQIPHGVQTGKSAPEVAHPSLDARLHTSRGTFLRSKSFSSASANQKVQRLDEVVPQKHKSNREAASLGTKGGVNRMMGKSRSFHSVNSGGSNSTDSKAKMLSPKFSHGQDMKSHEHTKERSLVKRKNSLRLERPLVNSAVSTSTSSSPRIDKNLPIRDETVPFSSTSNNREFKSMHSDNRLTQLSRPVNKVINKGSEVPVPSGEGSGIGNVEEKSMQARMKDDRTSTPSTGGPIRKFSESLPDGLSKARVLTNLVESAKEISSSQPKHSTAGGKITPCQKCNVVGHTAESCTIDSTEQSLVPDVHTSRSSKDPIHEDNRLKAAIEAALLKKPGIYRKKRAQDHTDELTVSGINSEECSQDQLSNTRNPRKLVYGDQVSKEPASAWNTDIESVKKATGSNVKQFTNSSEAVNALLRRPIAPADGMSVIMDLLSNAPVSISDLPIMSAIPKHDYIWQGCFEVCRSGKQPGCYDGFQAHLSAGASPRVLETVNKFPSTVLLNELPRRSVWPIQFEETGVSEDHIALYFFARDFESYEKSYKSILESMIRNDLALKGNIDGVEILIFPSNQLPVNYQRWNTMFFFWGVFKGKRKSCLQKVPVSPKRTAGKTVSHFQQSDCVNSTNEQQGYRFDCNSMPPDQMNPPQSLQDKRSRTNSLERQVDQDFKLIKEPQAATQVSSSACDFNPSDEKKTGHLSTPYNFHALSQIHSKVSAGVQDPATAQSVGEADNEEKLGIRNTKIEGFLEAETDVDRVAMKFSSPKEPCSWPLSNFDFLVSKSGANFAGSSRAVHGNDRNETLENGGIVNKKPRSGYNDLYDSADHTSSSRDSVVIQDSTSIFPVQNKCEEGSNETLIQTPENAERYFFPVHVNHVDLGDSSILRKRGLSEDVEEPLQNKIPNLNLALGDDEIKLPLKQSLPHFLAAEIEKNKQNQPSGKLPLKQSLPHFLAAEIEKNNQDHPRGRTVTTVEEDVSAALSLSFSFPFADKEQADRAVETKELLPLERQHEVNFLRGFSDK
ncbi:uncharacterized protein LOC141693523 isoform X2 [Apium graveolens]